MRKQINQIYEFGDFRLDTGERLLLRQKFEIPETDRSQAFDSAILAREAIAPPNSRITRLKNIYREAEDLGIAESKS